MRTETFKRILLTVPHTFRMELVRIICLNIKTFILGFLFLHSHHLNVQTSSFNDTTSDSELQSSNSKDKPGDSEDDAQ